MHSTFYLRNSFEIIILQLMKILLSTATATLCNEYSDEPQALITKPQTTTTTTSY